MTRKPPAAKPIKPTKNSNTTEDQRATERQKTTEQQRVTANESTNVVERVNSPESTNVEERASGPETPSNSKRAKTSKKTTSQQLLPPSDDPPSFQQTQKALRRYVENFYDIQEMRLAAGGRTAKKPRKDKNGNVIPEIKLHEWDKQRLIATKDSLQTSEDLALQDVELCLQRIPFYTEVLIPQKAHYKGLGPTMAAVILSSFDINKGDTVSKFWALAGLRPMPCMRCKVCQAVVSDNEDETFMHPKIDKVKCSTKGEPILTINQVFASMQAQRPQAGVKLNFNKWLRTKLVGVLGPVILKMTTFHCPKCHDKMAGLKDEDKKPTGFYAHPARGKEDERPPCHLAVTPLEKDKLLRIDAPFRKFYDDYKHRKEHAGWGMSDGHRHNAAVRYMIKMLLLDLHTKWRKHSGLPVRPTYQEQYLGHTHQASQGNQSTEVSLVVEDPHTMEADQGGEDNQTSLVNLELEQAILEEEIARASA